MKTIRNYACKKRFAEHFSCRLRICCYFLKIRSRLTEALTTSWERAPFSCSDTQSCRIRSSHISIDILSRDIATQKISSRSDNSFGRYCMPKCKIRTCGACDFFYIMRSFARTVHRQTMKFGGYIYRQTQRRHLHEYCSDTG